MKRLLLSCRIIVLTVSVLCAGTDGAAASFDRAETLEWFRSHWFGRTSVGRPADERFDAGGITCCGGKIRIGVFLKLPEGASAEHPVPVFVFGDHRRHPEPPHQKLVYDNIPTNAIVSRGYAYVCWNFNDVAPDVAVQSDDYARWAEGILALQAKGDPMARGVERGEEDWGTLGAWAWGYSRVVDWIESRPELDARRIAVIGHSRGGKTALWAGAQDERIALTISNDSGTGGARLLRTTYGACESVEAINRNFPNWFCRRFRGYSADPSRLEHDADDLLKLIAPRLLYVASASEDPWAGPPGEFAAAKAASREWERRGLKGLALEAFPAPGEGDGTGCVGYHLRPGRHKLLPYDWQRYLDFADRHFKGKDRAATPLPEHPRPDWERREWVNLNGPWDFGFGPDRYDRTILVPFGWGSPASGVPDGGDRGYYRRKLVVPKAWRGKRVFVVVGASDHDTECSFAGRKVGTNVGGYVPFEFELTEHVRWGEEQELAFAVWDPSDEVARNGHYLYGKQGYGNVRGIWQTVYLEARGRDCLESVRFTPHLATSSVTVDIGLKEPANRPLAVRIDLDGRTTDVPISVGERGKRVEIRLSEPKRWSPESPHLYDVVLSLGAREGGVDKAEDVVRTYFGFREIGTGRTPNGDACVTLNGKPLYLQLCLDQSYHPKGYYTFPSDDFIRNDLLLTKRLALTGQRVHIKVEVPRKLYWADRLGLLIQSDVPNAWGNPSGKMFDEHWSCFERMVKRDFNHPCIYQWTLFNETWGLYSNRSLSMGLASGAGGKKRVYEKETQETVAACYAKAKTLDPTRLVEDNSPCARDHVVTDVNSWHAYCPGYHWEWRVSDVCKETFAGSPKNFVAGKMQGNEPMMNSECGNVWGYEGSTGDCDFSWDYHLMINAFRRHLKCTGWLYTEHHDVINEWNGYVRFDRTPKFDGLDALAGMSLKDLHSAAALFFAGTVCRETGETVMPGAEIALPVGVSLVTDRYAGRRLTLSHAAWWFDGEGRRQKRAAKTEKAVAVARSWQCEKVWNVALRAPKEPACGCVVFRLLADGEEVARNFWSFSTVRPEGAAVLPVAANWEFGTTNVLDGLKVNGFGKGAFEFVLEAPKKGGVFRAELSSKRLNRKDLPKDSERRGGLDFMLGGGGGSRSRNPNSYPQTSSDRHPATLRVLVDGKPVKTVTLADDPADHRGILSWLAQPHDQRLREAGSYGWLVEAPVPASAVKDGKVRIRLESDAGLAVYGRRFGRYPLDPHVR